MLSKLAVHSQMTRPHNRPSLGPSGLSSLERPLSVSRPSLRGCATSAQRFALGPCARSALSSYVGSNRHSHSEGLCPPCLGNRLFHELTTTLEIFRTSSCKSREELDKINGFLRSMAKFLKRNASDGVSRICFRDRAERVGKGHDDRFAGNSTEPQ